ncbi:MAG: polysaccharide pyruvyl transferase family protein [Alphaproteobacteria bacterium]|nr:polysaccharide pyruvyl transferase family protein [Alphaproteobacteria bacterium]
MKNTGYNTGNLAFWYAVHEMYRDPTTLVPRGSDGAEYRDRVDCLVIPAANHLNPQWDLGVFADLITSIDKEVVVMGLGAQANDEKQNLELQSGTVRYLKVLADHARVIFVRGPYTAQVCASYGVKNVEVLGCPSVTINADPGLGALIEARYSRELERLYFAGAAFKGELNSIERTIFQFLKVHSGTYVVQAPAELIDCAMFSLPFGEVPPIFERAREILDPEATQREFRESFRRIGRSYFSVRAWLEAAAQHDYAISTRVHGAILSLMAGVPTLVVGHDTRVRELCETLQIPCVKPADLMRNLEDISGVVQNNSLKGVSFDVNRQRIARRYSEYLRQSGLTPSESLSHLCGHSEILCSDPERSSGDSTMALESAKITQHQTEKNSAYNRYPKIFARAKELADQFALHDGPVLSYGCSVGEETRTLSELYFPKSKIIGVDIDQKILGIAKSKSADAKNIKYYLSTDDNIQANGPYSLIFAMSVFCRWPASQNLEDISSLYPFRVFESGLAVLDRNLQVGGLLVIANSNFDFLDTTWSVRYEDMIVDIDSSGFVKRFGRENRPTGQPAPPSCIFRKLA